MDIADIPMVVVTWRDAQESDGSWTNVEDILKHDCAICQDVGFLVLNNDDKLIVMRSMILKNGTLEDMNEELEEGSSYIAIPKCWVLNVQELVPSGTELAPVGATVSDC